LEHSRARATMREVAALAGVSLKTVSRVVNAEAGVSAPLRDRVLRAADQLDYRHNMAASNLRRSGNRTGVVGALLQDVSNSFSSGLLLAIEDAANERGTAVLAASLDEESDRERQRVADLVSRRVDGLVLMPASNNQEYLLSERRAGLPIVFVDRLPRGIDADSVTVDNRAGAREAVEHLLAVGHRRIALLGDLDTIQTAQLRRQGYQDALTAAGIVADPCLVVTDLRTAVESAEAVGRLLALDQPPTALLATRNVISAGAVRQLREMGLNTKVAIVGFDDFPLADLFDPPLTVVRQNVGRIGAEVARILFERLDGDQSPPWHVVVQHTLVVRGSGEIAPP
jgi:LacI family transcriptional regulator